MQSKGTIQFVTVLVILACLYQLSFTWVTSRVDKKADKYATENIAGIASVNEQKKSNYLDSIATDPVYPLGLFNYKQCKERELLLGLDLKGGMNVMLELTVADLIKSMADNSTDPDFLKVIDLANKKQLSSGSDYITLFNEAWNEVAKDKKMSSIFSTYALQNRIKPESTNAEVISEIRAEAESAIANSFNVLRNRIDRFGVVSPNIQRVGSTGRILIELPGVKEPERVRKLLKGTASLEFWETFSLTGDQEGGKIYNYLVFADNKIREINAAKKALSTNDTIGTAQIAADTTKNNQDLLDQLAIADSATIAKNGLSVEEHPLFALLNCTKGVNLEKEGPSMHSARIGRAHRKDMAMIDSLLSLPQVAATRPSNFKWAWGNKPVDSAGVVYELVAIKVNPANGGKAPLDGSVVTDARKEFNQASGSPYPHVSMRMNTEGANTWARLTAANVGKSIAILLDGYVYSYPNVINEIKGGDSQITGNFTTEEADDLVNVLRSGKMPVPARIVQEAVVGPTLGQESINAGMFSFILAFIIILIYLWIFYNVAGLAANVALIVNVLLIFGTLASFGAVLTMPGIAGIVLTLGMAIDANIIIYERIKEELSSGKAQRLAITDGYKNAYSAIIDGQLTTLITGIVLLIFGSGPVRGFATTLIIGIITSLFTSIFITRLIFEWLLNRGKTIKFGFAWSLSFLKNTHFDFLKIRKYTFIISSVILLIGVISMFTRGFSLGVDFTGGRTYVVKFDKSVTTNEIRSALSTTLKEGVEVKQFGASNQMKITTKYKYNDQSENVDKETETLIYDAVKNNFQKQMSLSEFVSTQDNPYGIISSEKVGPTIASDITRGAFWAVIIALIAVFVYIAIRFSRWQWGAGGVLALAHDALFTLSVFSLGWGFLPWNMDVDQTFIAAILTIIGYSINDTVVIFDRIRENHRLYPKRDLYGIINESINSTLTRTINTSLTTLLVLLAIFFFGGDVIRGFAFAMSLGVIIGTYSTLFIAVPFSYELLKRSGKSKEIKPELLKK